MLRNFCIAYNQARIKGLVGPGYFVIFAEQKKTSLPSYFALKAFFSHFWPLQAPVFLVGPRHFA